MTTSSLRALGLDPSIRHFGWAVVEDGRVIAHGQINTPDMLAALELSHIYDEMLRLIDTYRPEVVGCEDTYIGNNRTTAMRLSEVRGVAMLACVLNSLPCWLFKPATLKAALAGNGRSNKRDMVRAAQERFGLDKITDNEADAIAAALCAIDKTDKGLLVA